MAESYPQIPLKTHFQRLVRELSDTNECEHQIILFTSMIAPEFENDKELLIGPRYTRERKSLEFALAQ
jgi:hypothetical protein